MAYKGQMYHDESDADDEYERSILSPTAETHFTPSSPTDSESEAHSNQHTPTYSGKEPKEYIKKWSIKQCAEFIASLGLEQYNEAVVEEEIDGEALIALQQDDLKDLGIASVGHRLTILKAVYEIKVQQNVPMEPDHYIPPSADANAPDANATQDDVARIIKQIQLRDERLRECEAELQRFQEMFVRFQEEHRKFREDVLPLARMAKDKSAPLPTPDGLEPSNPLSPPPTATVDPTQPKGLTRKISRKTVFSSNMKIPSPTIQDGSHHLEASAAALAASNHLTASMSSQGNSSPHMSQQPSPTSPHYQSAGSTLTSHTNLNLSSDFANVPHRDRIDMNSGRQRTTPTSATHPLTTTTTNTSQSNASNTVTTPSSTHAPTSNPSSSKGNEADSSNNFMKSFRVSLDEPCHKVLPVALKKYNIPDDWRLYSLYIVHGDQERCLGLEEKPLILFKQLANEGKKPMFMLRKHAPPAGSGFETGKSSGSGTHMAPPGPSGNLSSGGGSQQAGSFGGNQGGPSMSSVPPGMARHSYASGMHLPGGVL